MPYPPFPCNGCTTTWTGLNKCHCAGCHRTFGGTSAFTRHRDRTGCKDPAGVGLELTDSGVWISQCNTEERAA